MTPSCGRVRARWKTWGRWDINNSLLKVINLFKGKPGAFRFVNFLPNRSTKMKSAAHPVSINRPVVEATFRGFATRFDTESAPECWCCIAT